MAKYHINPQTGNPGVCRASIQCRFGGQSSHFATKEEARADYEDSQKLLATTPQSPNEAFDLVEKDFKRGLELLDSTRTNDGSAFGSSKRSRAEEGWRHARYLISQYVNKGESWEDRRGYYHQVSDTLRKVRHEFGEGDWGGPRDVHKPLLARLSALHSDFRTLCGPEGASKEKELGFYKGA